MKTAIFPVDDQFLTQTKVQATDVGRNPFDATMDQLVARVLGELHVPGMALGVVDGTETWSKVSEFTRKDLQIFISVLILALKGLRGRQCRH